ncbi:uncharacterized protein CMU_016690 [Cryptosporidium muris RN66]|uniref:Uncharacterized protein n=1 Tax=Cryptosporidium muris (strain RN66) TaxID=441375 RepID=B6ACR5_CRYMR|nr:uncharacterized protein CMU_016690 [Cryptosporidium muris RN66]EEA05919.1 hypothetical protein, conserved [Cryptosporidium muris RN66]|eukprot:XP_002140268.1 hypothetical protein [Cryptosporidium muris RN66]
MEFNLFGIDISQNSEEDKVNIKNLKKVPKHFVITFRDREASEKGVLVLLYKSLCLLKTVNVEYVTIFEPTGIVQSKLTPHLRDDNEVPTNIRFLTKKDSIDDFFEKIVQITNISRSEQDDNENKLTFKNLYESLNCGGTWPPAECILILRNLPLDVPLNGVEDIIKFLRRLREYLATFTIKPIQIVSMGAFGNMPPILPLSAEL